MNVLALAKETERYVFIYDDASVSKLELAAVNVVMPHQHCSFVAR